VFFIIVPYNALLPVNPLGPSGNYMNHLLLTFSNVTFCIYGFCMVLTVNSDYFRNQH
jgi:hypothetical protein